jgi:hypothetical protein
VIDTLFSYGANARLCSQIVPHGVYRIRSNESDDDVAVYVGPSGSDTIYTVPLSAVSIINASGTSHQYSTESKQGDMDVSTAQTRWNCITSTHAENSRRNG